MNKEELKKEAERNSKALYWYCINMSNEPNEEVLNALITNFMEITEPREKQIKELSKHIVELQKDKGELIDENKRLKNEIEDLRGYCNQIKKIKTAIIKLFEKI